MFSKISYYVPKIFLVGGIKISFFTAVVWAVNNEQQWKPKETVKRAVIFARRKYIRVRIYELRSDESDRHKKLFAYEKSYILWAIETRKLCCSSFAKVFVRSDRCLEGEVAWQPKHRIKLFFQFYIIINDNKHKTFCKLYNWKQNIVYHLFYYLWQYHFHHV